MSSDDIVTRLREKYQGQLPICIEAADEIERLRAELLEAQQHLGLLRRSRDRRDDEIERLRTSGKQLLDALTEMSEKGMLPKITFRLRDAAQTFEQAVRGE